MMFPAVFFSRPAVFISRTVTFTQRVFVKTPATILALTGFVFLTAGCADSSSSDSGASVNSESQSPGTALRTSSFATSTLCPNGGILFELGFDSNQNDALDDDEVQITQEVCHGVDGVDGTDGTDGTDGEDGTPGLASLIELTVEEPGANCLYGGTRVDSGLDADNNGSLAAVEISQTRFVCEPQSCDWTDNDDGTTTISCEGEEDRVVLNPEALGFSSRISCGVSIDHPDGGSMIPLIYTVDAIGDDLKFVTLTVFDGDVQINSSRLITSTTTNPPEFNFSAISVYFDTYGTATGGRYQASLNESENELALIYFDTELPDGEPVGTIIRAFADSEGAGACNKVVPVAD